MAISNHHSLSLLGTQFSKLSRKWDWLKQMLELLVSDRNFPETGFYFGIFYNIKYLALMQETTLFFACSFLVGAKTFACSKKITDLRMGQY